MPLFTYECADCLATAEILARTNARPKCPTCGGQKMSKALSRFAAVSANGDGGFDPGDCTMGNMCCGGGCGVPQN